MEGSTEPELLRYVKTLRSGFGNANGETDGNAEEIRTTPLFTWPVKLAAAKPENPSRAKVDYVQFGLLGSEANDTTVEPIFMNTNAPWSAFICGSQGSGKSHTLSTILENCLLTNPSIGRLPKPLSAMVFHYSTHSFNSVCEAAFIASTGARVRVLVSPSNSRAMKISYHNLLGGKNKIQVIPLMLQPKHMNTERMLKLMAMSDTSTGMPLYMEVIVRILREMATSEISFNYQQFVRRLEEEKFSRDQCVPLNMRLRLLESFMDMKPNNKLDIFECPPGSLTIVDLTDPFVDASTACVLFEICLALFLDDKASAKGRIIGLDEAHKYMSSTPASMVLTETLLTTIREQRHTASRVIICTQEPTIAPSLLDLCSITIVHRFTSPAWLETLRKHIAATSNYAKMNASEAADLLDLDNTWANESPAQRLARIFEEIVTLAVGQSLVFSPSSMLRLDGGEPKKIGTAYIKMKTRPRISADGGRSILAYSSKR